ncbi:hypothetical protein ACQUW5_00770 [Legionella sp. CNM-1927-20]|uniref:hypothetical protein n=1 Tax=Legionella sp. CNM-1927-20 TaxID=3422221 RepID=UPI00403B1EE1
MKIIKSIIWSVSILTLSSTVLAASNNCPPINLIKDAKFIKASNLINDWWVLTSGLYNYQNRVWETKFKFPGYFNSESEALKLGIITFTSVSNGIHAPDETEDKGKLICIYTDSYDYQVYAQSQ